MTWWSLLWVGLGVVWVFQSFEIIRYFRKRKYLKAARLSLAASDRAQLRYALVHDLVQLPYVDGIAIRTSLLSTSVRASSRAVRSLERARVVPFFPWKKMP